MHFKEFFMLFTIFMVFIYAHQMDDAKIRVKEESKFKSKSTLRNHKGNNPSSPTEYHTSLNQASSCIQNSNALDIQINEKNIDDHTGEITKISQLEFSIWNRKQRSWVPWKDLKETHRRKIHIVIASTNNEMFLHIHPEDFNSNLSEETTNFMIQVDISSFPSWILKAEAVVRNPEHCHQRSISISKEIALHYPFDRTETDTPSNPDLSKDNSTIYFHGVPLKPSSERYVNPIPLTLIQPSKSFFHSQVRHEDSTDLYVLSIPQFKSIQENHSLFKVNHCKTLFFNIAKYDNNLNEFLPISNLSNILNAQGHLTSIFYDPNLTHKWNERILHSHSVAISKKNVPTEYWLPSDHESKMDLSPSLFSSQDTQVQGKGSEFIWKFNMKNSLSLTSFDLCKNPKHQHTMDHAGNNIHSNSTFFGPWIAAGLSLPHPGFWRIVIQLRHGNTLLNPSFWVHVSS